VFVGLVKCVTTAKGIIRVRHFIGMLFFLVKVVDVKVQNKFRIGRLTGSINGRVGKRDYTFTIAKSGLIYDNGYRSVLVRN